MKNREKSFLQKLKDNAFNLSLGVGLLAILAVVAVYTTQQNEKQLAENNLDLNVASDYSTVSEEGLKDDILTETNAEITKDDDSKENQNITGTEEVLAESGIAVDVETAGMENEDAKANEETEEANTAENVTADDGEVSVAGVSEDGEELAAGADDTKNTETEEVTADVAEQESIPVTVNAGELDFSSEKTITWPVNGEVILPYSMETTVHFKTLDQYQCNPGMLIKAGIGTTVQNAYNGQVTKVTSDNTYGNLVTVYLGNDYSIVYGQLDTIYVKEGDFVKAGQSIGTVGNPTDSFKEEGSHLFFQMLQGEETVDPMMFIE